MVDLMDVQPVGVWVVMKVVEMVVTMVVVLVVWKVDWLVVRWVAL